MHTPGLPVLVDAKRFIVKCAVVDKLVVPVLVLVLVLVLVAASCRVRTKIGEERRITMARGALIFKGDATSTLPRKKSSKSKKRQALSSDLQSERTTHAPIIRAQDGASQSSPQILPIVGRGKIAISGTVVTGYDTKFSADLQVGDAILVNNEMRVITMCL